MTFVSSIPRLKYITADGIIYWLNCDRNNMLWRFKGWTNYSNFEKPEECDKSENDDPVVSHTAVETKFTKYIKWLEVEEADWTKTFLLHRIRNFAAVKLEAKCKQKCIRANFALKHFIHICYKILNLSLKLISYYHLRFLLTELHNI